MASLAGQSIGHYRVIKELGKGGMAIVYKALDTRLEREVALKVILPGREQSGNFQKRFALEAKTQARLNHANIVKVLDFGELDDMPFLVMEYQPGGTLKERLGAPLQWREAAGLLAPIASALEYIHLQGTIHRDVKPANILFSQSGNSMLSDFGITKILDAEETEELTATGIGIGTPEYMAPEQGQGLDVDFRSDIYSLGVVFYELVTGRKPFSADTPMMILHKQITDPLIPPRQFVPQLPLEVEQVLMKALAKKPENRYQATADFATDLQRIAKGEEFLLCGETTELVTEEVTVDDWASRKKSWTPWLLSGAGILGMGIILLAVVIGGIFLLKGKGGNPSSPLSLPYFDSSPTSVPWAQEQDFAGIQATTESIQFPTIFNPTIPQQNTSTPSPNLYYPIPDCAASRIHLGDSVFVSFEGGDNAIRSSSDLHSSTNKIEIAVTGDVLTITGNPQCSYNWIVWPIMSTKTGAIGWTPESDGKSFWLVPITTWQVCSGSPRSRLHVGNTAFVGMFPALSNKVRNGAGTSYSEIGRIGPGEYIAIEEGPSCADGYVWWKILSQNNGLTGWTAEGDSSNFWLVPVIQRH